VEKVEDVVERERGSDIFGELNVVKYRFLYGRGAYMLNT
jgi:hypothetical protein